MKVTGERVSTAEGGFNPTYQRHVAAYAVAAELLPAAPARVLDLGCGVGHSYHLLAPRETVGVDLDARALAGQDRETHVADMRALPFPPDSFDAVVSVQSLEHVPDAGRVVAEVVRVLRPGGIAVFVTPNRLTFGRPDEIVDPYHYVEYDPDELRALLEGSFADVRLHGLFGSERMDAFWARERARMERLLSLDRFRLRDRMPKRALQFAYDAALSATRRRRADPVAASITVEDFHLDSEDLERALDLVAVCTAR